MRRTLVVALMVALVVFAPVGMAAHAPTTVISSHTTDSELAGAQTLDNLTVTGSGASASADLDSVFDLNEGWEDGDGTIGVTGYSASAVNVEADNAISGSYLANITAVSPQSGTTSAVDSITSEANHYPDFVGMTVRQDGTGASSSGEYGRLKLMTTGNAEAANITFDRSTNQILVGHAGGETALQSMSEGQNYDIRFESINYAGNTFSVSIDGTSYGPYTAKQDISVDGVEYVNVIAFADGTGASSQYMTMLYDDVTWNGGTWDDGQYLSANHSAENPDTGFVDLQLTNATADITWEGYSGGSWTTVNSTTVSSTTNESLALSGGHTTWRVQVDITRTGPDSVAEIESEGVIGPTDGPTVDNASASPQGDPIINDPDVNLSVPVEDPDFGRAQGDTVTVEFFVDGQSQGTDTLTSNGTASLSVSGLEGGNQSWYAVATDEYGHQQTTQTFKFTTPATISVFNESAPSNLVDNTTLRVRFFEDGNQTVVEKTVTNGTVDLAGLPVSNRIIVTVDDTNSSFHYRRVVLRSIYDQSEIYLLPKSANSADINFQLDDATGRFPASQTILFVERPLTKDFDGDGTNETQYRTVAGDDFGAAQDFPVTLAVNERYRLRVENSQGETRVLGSYTPTQDAVEPIPIGQVTFRGSADSGPAIDARIIEQSDGSRDIRIVYRDANMTTDELTIQVHGQGNESDILQPNTTYAGPHGTLVVTYDVPASAPDDVAYEVDFYATIAGESVTATRFVGDVPELAAGWNIDPQVLSLMGWTLVVGLTGLTVIYSPRLASIVGVVTAGFVAAIGVTTIPVPVLALAGSVALLWNVAGGTTA